MGEAALRALFSQNLLLPSEPSFDNLSLVFHAAAFLVTCLQTWQMVENTHTPQTALQALPEGLQALLQEWLP